MTLVLLGVLLGVLFGVLFGVLAAPAAARNRPIFDTHVHIYEVSRPGGVPWPPPSSATLYRDMTPAGYKALAKPAGVVLAGVVEASPLPEDNAQILERTRDDRFFRFVVPRLEIGAADFVKSLDELARDRRVVGIRGFGWGGKVTLDATQIGHLQELARRGMTLDVVCEGAAATRARIAALAEAVPTLRIVIDDLGGAKGETPDPQWVADMRRLGARANVYVKLSSFFDMFDPSPNDDEPWKSPLSAGAYKPHFDVLMDAFGPDRLVWGSNWPVVELGGGLEAEIQVAEDYFQPLGNRVRDKVMYQNALKLYRRTPPKK